MTVKIISDVQENKRQNNKKGCKKHSQNFREENNH
jgi:hypothetical protein